MGRVTTRVPVARLSLAGGAVAPSRPDALVVEEPLELRLRGEVLTVTMRTPGDDIDLVHGYLLAEGVIRTAADVVSARYCAGSVRANDGTAANTYNVIDVDLGPSAAGRRAGGARLGLTTSACGVCGTASIDALRDKLPAAGLADLEMPVTAEVVARMLAALRAGQPVFDRTGGAHGAAVVDAAGRVRARAEDVGRHNAVDKAIGHLVRAGETSPLGGSLVVSSRASYEIVQKAAVAGIPVVVAVSAPSSLAVEAARELGMTLLAFARDEGVNVYADRGRLAAGAAS